jgi:hypothetical protein
VAAGRGPAQVATLGGRGGTRSSVGRGGVAGCASRRRSRRFRWRPRHRAGSAPSRYLRSRPAARRVHRAAAGAELDVAVTGSVSVAARRHSRRARGAHVPAAHLASTSPSTQGANLEIGPQRRRPHLVQRLRDRGRGGWSASAASAPSARSSSPGSRGSAAPAGAVSGARPARYERASAHPAARRVLAEGLGTKSPSVVARDRVTCHQGSARLEPGRAVERSAPTRRAGGVAPGARRAWSAPSQPPLVRAARSRRRGRARGDLSIASSRRRRRRPRRCERARDGRGAGASSSASSG